MADKIDTDTNLRNEQLLRELEALRESEERFRQLAEANFEGIIIHEKGIIIEANQSAAEIFGYERTEMIGMDVLELMAPGFHELVAEKNHSGATDTYESMGLRKDGSTFHEEIHVKSMEYRGRQVCVAAIRDITERKKTEEALRIQKRYQEELFEGSPDAVVILDNNDRVVSINREFRRLFGFSEEEAVGKRINDLIVPPKMKDEAELLTSKVKISRRFYVESVRQSKDGRLIDVSITGKPIVLHDNQLAVYGIYRDITARKRAERLKDAAYKIAGAVLISDDLHYLMVSIHKIIGELIPAGNFYIALYDPISDMISFPYFVDEYDDTPAPKKPGKGLTEYVLHTGRPLLAKPEVFADLERKGEVQSIGAPSVDWLGVPLKIKEKTIGILTVQSYAEGTRFGEEEKNILVFVSAQIAMAIERKRAEEERQKLEEQLLQAQKLEAIGTLAGGIAHDFNNILSAIMGYTELALLKVPEESKLRANLKQVLSASGRARETVKQILAFSRKEEREQRPVFLNDVVNEVLILLRSTLPATIEIRAHVEKTGHPVLANPSQVHQVIMNLCTNAAFAMREKGGTLEIALEEIDFDPAVINRKDLQPGRYNRLTVSDTGRGMTPEVRSRIFEPYFTTKQHGEGTGMGLAVVHGIVKTHGGEIAVYSVPGKGTTFDIFLPVTDTKRDNGMVTDKTAPPRKGKEKILFVDDDQSLAEVGKELLENLGYRVDCKTSSIDALKTFRSHPDKFDLVITDQTMPHMTGVQLAGELKNIRPDIPVILCTGFSENINEENYASKGINSFIMKPLGIDEIARAVRRILDKRKTAEVSAFLVEGMGREPHTG